MKYAWIDGQQGAYPMPALCATLSVSMSGYQAWKRGCTANRKRLSDIRARHKRRYKATTDSRHSLPVAPNRLNRNFTPSAPNQVWTADLN